MYADTSAAVVASPLRLISFGLMLAAVSMLPAQAQSSWKSSNPGGGGAFNSPVVTSEGYWAVGSDLGGLYVSTDSGASWSVVGATEGLAVTHVSAIASRPGKLLIGTENGLFLGNSNGTGFSRKYPSGYIAAVAVSADPNIVYAAVHSGFDSLQPYLIRSTNGGESWSPTGSNLPANLRVTGMRTHPVDTNGVWVLSGRGRFPERTEDEIPYHAYFSTNGGASFIRLDPQQGRVVDVAYALDPNNLNLMYASVVDANHTARLYKSTETGFSWSLIGSGASVPAGMILADPANANRVRVVDLDNQALRVPGTYGSFLWESTNAGASWSKRTLSLSGGWSRADEDWGMGYSYQGMAQTLGYNPARPQTVLWSNNQFVHRSADGGRTWADSASLASGSGWRSRGLDNVVPIVIEQSQADANLVYAGYMDIGLWRSDDGGGSWTALNPSAYTGGWAGKGGNTLSVIADPARANVVWAQMGGNLERCGTPCNEPMYLLKSNDRGASWQRLTQGLPNPIRRLEGLVVAHDSAVDYRWVTAAVNGDIYQSQDGGSTWQRVLDCPGDDCFRVYYTASNGMFALSPTAIYRSWQGGPAGSWSAMALPADLVAGWTPGQHWLHHSWVYAGPMDLASRDNNLWIAVKGNNKGLYRSGDYGQSWTRVQASNWARSVSVHPSTGRVYFGSSSAVLAGNYAADSQGVLTSADGVSGFVAQNAGLVFPFALYTRVSANGALWVASPGQGVMKWR
ncbi:WD40/YVTN/BNR-like repeat-containing protein [Pseudomonas sp. CGJS7]|uniref:WD40/YVTN/BNR-like repeat-containing protein n=1 Tax=Pseudomonas sp. CGJS7 TaxID=3109348 RepID=UPI00300B9A7F